MSEIKFQETSGSLFSLNVNIEQPKLNPNEELFYFVNFGKMTSVNDLIVVLQAMGFGISASHPLFEQVKPFLDLDKGIAIPKKLQ